MLQKQLINNKMFSPDIENPIDQILMGSFCKDCNTIYFPQKRVCPNCMHIDRMELRELSKTGKLISFTTSYVGPPGFEPPYAYGWIDLPEGIRLFSLLTDCKPFEEKLRLDMPVEVVMDKIKVDSNGTEIYGYKFKPL